jgi:hypothetical protein
MKIDLRGVVTKLFRRTQKGKGRKPTFRSRSLRPSAGNEATKVYRWVIAGLLALSGALGTALVEQVTGVFKNEIHPLITSSTCEIQEAFRHNTAPNRFTVVVLPFSNDPTNRTQEEISAALAKIYGINVISSCKRVDVPTSGDRDRNIKNARKWIAKILDKYKADLIVFGTINRDKEGHPTQDSEIVVSASEYNDYLFDPQYSTKFDGLHPQSVLYSEEFLSDVTERMKNIGESAHCLTPIVGGCPTTTPSLKTEQLRLIFDKILDLQQTLVNSRRIQYSRADIKADFTSSSYFAAAIAVELFNRQNKTRASNRDLLENAKSLLRFAGLYGPDGRYNAGMMSITTSDSLAQSAAVELIEARALCSGPDLVGADEDFSQAIEQGHVFDVIGYDIYDGTRPALLLTVLEGTEAKLGLYAVRGPKQEDALWKDFADDASKSLALVKQWRPKLSPTAGGQDMQVGTKMLARLDQETSLVEQALKERGQSRIFALLGLNSCASQ